MLTVEADTRRCRWPRIRDQRQPRAAFGVGAAASIRVTGEVWRCGFKDAFAAYHQRDLLLAAEVLSTDLLRESEKPASLIVRDVLLLAGKERELQMVGAIGI